MTDQQQASGRDLARQALAAYKAASRSVPAAGPGRKTRTRPRPTERGTGRDPVGVGDVLGTLGGEQGWAQALTGGSISDQWATLCPAEYANSLQPIGYDPATGVLTLKTDSHTTAAHLRIAGSLLVAHLNTALGGTPGKPAVRALKVDMGALAPVSGKQQTAPPPRSSQPKAPVRTRETASAGYHRVLALALEHKPSPQDHDHTGTASARSVPQDPRDASRQAAIRYKHSGGQPVRRVFESP